MDKHEVSKKDAHKAAETLRDPKATKNEKSAAGAELSHRKNQMHKDAK